jgi:hypothetical protein
MLFPEMVARITFLAEAPTSAPADHAVLIPTIALLDDNGKDYVFVMDAGRARKQNVTTDGAAGTQTRITGGLQSGQRVITSHLASLQPGMAVQEK